MAANDKLEQLFAESVAAQNRTTHAVRALTTYVLYQVAWGLPSALLMVIGFTTQEPGWLFFGGFLSLIGFAHAFISAFTELGKSKIRNYSKGARLVQGIQADIEWSTDDIENGNTYLSDSEYDAWFAAGMPSLQSWYDEGFPEFDTWLAKQKS